MALEADAKLALMGAAWRADDKLVLMGVAPRIRRFLMRGHCTVGYYFHADEGGWSAVVRLSPTEDKVVRNSFQNEAHTIDWVTRTFIDGWEGE